MPASACSVIGGVEDALHDALELGIDLVERPRKTLGVLGHLKTAGGNAAGVGGLAREEGHAVVLQVLGCLKRGGHVSAAR